MDPQAAWERLIEAYVDGDWDVARETAFGLIQWLMQEGFPPQTIPGREMDREWNEALVRAAIDVVLRAARSHTDER